MARTRVGVFGGTFNPIHLGHLKAAEEVQRRFGLGRVLFIPSFIPPHKESAEIVAAAHRLRMVELACSGRRGFEASRLEVDAEGTSYSIFTLEKLRRRYQQAWIFFILGTDAFLDIETWREHDRVLEQCHFIVMSRPGFRQSGIDEILPARLKDQVCTVGEEETMDESLLSSCRVLLIRIEALDISSTMVRDRVRKEMPLSGLVPQAVEAYILKEGLYKGENG